MIPENEKVIKDIVWSVRRLVRAVYLDSQKMSKKYGLTGPQSGVLRSLFKYGPTSSADLSRVLYVTPSNITGVIDRLEKKVLVERVRKVGDRRVALIQLTEAGEKLSKKLPDPIEERFISELADLEPEHVQLLSMAMANCSTNIVCKVSGQIEVHTFIPMGNAIAALLPYMVDYYDERIPDKVARIAEYMRKGLDSPSELESLSAGEILRHFIQRLDLPQSLGFLGFSEDSTPLVTRDIKCRRLGSDGPEPVDPEVLKQIVNRAL